MGLFDFLRPAKRPSSPRRSGSSSSGRRLLVVPVDDSQHSLHAVEWTVQNLYRPDDVLHLVSVIPREAGPYPAEVLDADVPAPSSATVKAW